MVNKKTSPAKLARQTSLFFMALAVSSKAIASTCSAGSFDPADGSNCGLADPGFFVPNAGASQQTQASPGFFVSNSGASQQIAAPAGFFVTSAGATQATPAQPGFYVPTAGSSQQTAVSGGFYTAAPGADAQIPAGGLAAPLTAALQSSALFNNMASDLLDDSNPSMFKLATAYQHNKINQDGLGFGSLNSDIGAIILQANILQETAGNTGVQLAYGHHSITNSGNVNNDGDSFEVSVFKSGSILNKLRYHTFLIYGQTYYDNSRNVNIDAAATNKERLTTSGNISWYGVRSEVNYPILQRVSFVGDLGLLNYSLDSINENGVATLNGAPTASIASLSARSSNFVSLPFMTGFSYDIVPKVGNKKVAPFTFEAGLMGNLNSKKDIRLTSTNSGFSFDLPVNQSSMFAGTFALKLNEWEIAKGFNLSGITQAAIGDEIASFRFGVNVVKRW
jgi:hypothetical protein